MMSDSNVATTSTESKGREPLLPYVCDWISPYDIGSLQSCDSATAKKEIPRLNCRHAIERHVRFGRKIRTWTESRLDGHGTGDETLYYTSHNDRGLITLDIDCHRVGDDLEALRFAQFLKARYFPTLQYEVSTSGNGVHAYIKVTWDQKETDEATAKWLGKRFKRIQTWLNALVHEHGFELDGVEIKGPPTFVSERGDVIFGQPCRLPRRIENLARAPQHSIEELTAMARRDQTSIDQHREDLREEAVANPKERKMTRGSAGVSFSVITASMVSDQMGVADMLTEDLGLTASCNKSLAIVPLDMAITLAITTELTRDMNDDGTMPTARIRAVWESAYRNGIVDRQFHASRFAAIRNALVDSGLIRMVDNRYSHEQSDGQSKGTAMKWSINLLQVDVVHCLSVGFDFTSLASPTPQPLAVMDLETVQGGSLCITWIPKPSEQKPKQVRLRPKWVRAGELGLDRPSIPSLAA